MTTSKRIRLSDGSYTRRKDDAPGEAGGVEGAPLAGRRQATGADAPPRPVTRGETPTQANQTGRVSIDWLNCTFKGLEDNTPMEFVKELGALIERPIHMVQGRGLFGFEHGLKLFVKVGSLEYPLGVLCYGGESQRGRWMLQIPGGGCRFVRNWPQLAGFLEGLGAKITRVDLAMDFLDGEYSVDDAVRMYREGLFNGQGRPPSTSTAGDWLDGINGRTLYVGKAANGKLLRVYEKGIQMGEPNSPWVRFEVQLGSKDRVIPWKVLTAPASFLAGAYPALAAMIDQAAQSIPTEQKAAVSTLGALMFHLKRAYGKVIDAALTYTDADAMDLVESVRVVGRPKRLPSSAVDGGLTWGQITPAITRNKDLECA